MIKPVKQGAAHLMILLNAELGRRREICTILKKRTEKMKYLNFPLLDEDQVIGQDEWGFFGHESVARVRMTRKVAQSWRKALFVNKTDFGFGRVFVCSR
ncbi:hypothetical protein T4B_8785 [Trichinella pseudospiralis]|uniref:Uncharacterized protein n=1 Tax=Trichinella pseudospiralis TaxID=6337 RepID=A0A0V1JV50_TRIPS|nr:hypothetical protein T4B_8785 [Trichinella pseudospiralis]KRZ38846.1 hypothetical protein T4C_11307 [Trichinella pseudospiralis]